MSQPGLSLRWPHPSRPHSLNGVRRPSSNQILDHERYWTPRPGYRQGSEVREVTPAEGIMLNSRGERMTKAMRGTVGWLTPGGHRMKLEGTCMAWSTPHPTWSEFSMDICGSRDSWPRKSSPLISFLA